MTGSFASAIIHSGATPVFVDIDPVTFDMDPQLVEDAITLPVQVNGKKRADVTVARDADQAAIEAAVMSLDAIRRAMEGRPVRKIIIVPQRIVNVVA